MGLLYNDRRPGNTYVAELAEGSPGAFATTVVSQALSHPNESAFLQAGIPECEECAKFYGDYLGLDYGANMVWTDHARHQSGLRRLPAVRLLRPAVTGGGARAQGDGGD